MTQPHRIVDFGSPPRDPDRDAALLDVRQPERTRAEIVLSDNLERKLNRIEREYETRGSLARHGLPISSRILFVGPPGCGKTLCAEIIASDLGLPLLYARFDGVLSSYLGETASNLRRLFNYARSHIGVLFFDEFDAIGKKRDDPHEVGEIKRVVSSFLQQLDSYPRECIVVAATNHEGLLDEALWRRFDEVLYFRTPTIDQVERLLVLRLRGVRRKGIDLGSIAKTMADFTFADAERVCFEAAKSMHLSGKKEISEDILLEEVQSQRARLAHSAGRPAQAKK